MSRKKKEMTEEERETAVEFHRKQMRDSLRASLDPETAEALEGEDRHLRKNHFNYHVKDQYPMNGEVAKRRDYGPEVVTDVEVVEWENPDDEKIDREIRAMAERTPEVRVSSKRMMRPFSDDELKIIAAALKTRTALHRVADALHCSIHKVTTAIEKVPILKQLAEERIVREKGEVEEALDDLIKARVPAAVLFKAEHLLPEKYGNQVNLDNEDDTKLVIGEISEADVEEADRLVAEANEGVPDVSPNAVMQSLEMERAAEKAAGGGDVPAESLATMPKTPALYPPKDDPRYAPFIPAAAMGRVDRDDVGPDNYGAMGGGGFDDDGGFDDGSWI